MSANNLLLSKYTDLFMAYCTELDCLTDALGKIAASECALTEGADDVPALCLPASIDVDKIIRVAAEDLGRKLIKLAARTFCTAGKRPLKINVLEFSDHWNARPKEFSPLALWAALEHRFQCTNSHNAGVSQRSIASAFPQSTLESYR